MIHLSNETDIEFDDSDKEDMTSKAAEIKIKWLTMYNRKAADASYWIRSIYSYISLNNHIYDNYNKKVTFTLYFCREKVAKSWALGYYQSTMKEDGMFAFPSWRDFCSDFAKTFISSTTEQDA